MKNVKRCSYLTLCASLFLFGAFTIDAVAANITLQGVTASRALIAVDGGKPHWFAVNETYAGITVRAIDGQRVTLEADGQRQTLTLGDDNGRLNGGATNADTQQAVLHAGEGGHFFANGTINGASVRFVVDTGATMISMNSAEAQRIGIDYTKGEQGAASTAGGVIRAYKVTLDTVSVEGVTLNHVDALVQDNNALPVILLGMTFLNRMEMQRDGDTMTLRKRY